MDNKGVIKFVLKLVNVAKTKDGIARINREYSRKLAAFKGNSSFLKQVEKLYRYFRDPSTSKRNKALIGAGLLYFIIPTDLVGDFIPALGYLDDGVAIAYIWSKLHDELANYQKDGEVIDITSDVEIIEEEKSAEEVLSGEKIAEKKS